MNQHLVTALAAMALTSGLAACSSSSAPEQSAPPPASIAPVSPPATSAATPPPVERDGAGTAATGSTSAAASPPAAPVPSEIVPAAPAAPSPTPDPVPAPPPPRRYTLATGRALSVYTTSALSTKTNQTGEAFAATLAEAIVDGNWVIAKKGARVRGIIVDADPGARVKGVASIAVTLEALTLADSRIVELSASNYTRQAKTTKGKDAKKIGIGAGVGAAIGAIAGGGKGAAIGAGVGGGAGTGAVLATRGDPAVIPAETLIRVTLKSPVTITERRTSAGR